MRCEIRLLLRNDENVPFMGVGTLWLLQRIEQLHSIRQAALDMNMAYPKALRMIRVLEQELGASVVERYKGGADHGGARLTSFGQEFLQLYTSVVHDLQLMADKQFSGHLSQPDPPRKSPSPDHPPSPPS